LESGREGALLRGERGRGSPFKGRERESEPSQGERGREGALVTGEREPL